MIDIASQTRVDGQVAIVTGGGTGIGEACCEVLAAAGAHVVVAGRTETTITAVAKRVNGTPVVCDVSDFAQVEALFEAAAKITGRVDILINNAGGPGPIAPVADVDIDAWRACMEVNLFGAFHCLKAAAKIMTAQGSGSIVNMSSLMGIQGYPMRTAYSASKFALVGMTEAVAREVGPHGVRVNVLLPGAVSGGNMDRILQQRAQREGRDVAEIIRENYTDPAALKRWVDPHEVGYAALYFASAASGATTGEKMKVDCGRF
ncbi:MAG: SDR family NAD(P)-dependent oxidoreductase [Rhodospirillales bacterium]